MKKLLMGAIVLFLFAISLLIVQASCSKSNATPLDATSQLNKILFLRNWGSTAQIWTANYDGTGAAKVPLTLPANITIDMNVTTFSLSISPDGQTIFFTATDSSLPSPNLQIYSCDISGNNLKVVIPAATDVASHVHAY